MLRNVNISIEPPNYITNNKATRFVTITINDDGHPEIKKVEIINENDFQDIFSIIMDKTKKEVLKEYKRFKRNNRGEQL